jgi:hypothetical protein
MKGAAEGGSKQRQWSGAKAVRQAASSEADEFHA